MTIFSFISSVSRFVLTILALFASRAEEFTKQIGGVFERISCISGSFRDYSIAHRKAVLAVFILMTAGFAYSNVFMVRQGGIVDDNIIDPKDEFVQYDREARSRMGFEEFIPLTMEFPEGISDWSDLEKIAEWTRRAERMAEESPGLFLGVHSLSNHPDFRMQESESGIPSFSDDFFIPAEKSEGFGIEKWKRFVMESPDVYGFLAERNFKWAAVIIYLKPGFDERDVFWKIAELVEERQIPWWERLYKTDIEPKDPNIRVWSWITGRVTIYLTLPLENYKLICIGMVLVFFTSLVIFQSKAQAFFVTGMILISIVWTRGTIGIIDLLGFPVRERVFILACLTNNIVQGISFGLHKLHEYNKTGDWDRAKSVEMKIFNTTAIAVCGFMSLWVIRLFSIFELGLLSAIGVTYLFLMTVIVVPAIAWFPPTASTSTRTGAGYSRFIQRYVVGFCVKCAGYPAKAYLWLIVILFIIASYSAYNWLIIGSNPKGYIPGTRAAENSRFLSGPGMIGADAVSGLVEPRWLQEEGVYSVRYIRELESLQNSILRNVEGVRRASSVVNVISKISMQMYGTALPGNQEDLDSIFFLIENSRMPEEIQNQYWYHNGARLSLFTILDDPTKQEVFYSTLMSTSREHPLLNFLPFGKNVLYHRVDEKIRTGKPLNVLTSQWVVVIWCFWIIAYRARKLGSSRLSPWSGSVIMSVPFIFASEVMCLVMVAFRIPLDVATAIITALAINAAIDFSIYYQDAYQACLMTCDRERAVIEAMRSAGEVIINDIILNSLCFLPLSFSRFSPISRLGWMMVVMILACGIGSLIIMPSMLRHAVRKEK